MNNYIKITSLAGVYGSENIIGKKVFPKGPGELIAPIVNEKIIQLFKNITTKSLENEISFRDNLIISLKNIIAEHYNVSKDSIGDSLFDIPELSIENIKKLPIIVRQELDQNLSSILRNEISYEEGKNSMIKATNQETLRDEEKRKEIYNQKYDEYLEKYKKEGKNDPKQYARASASQYLSSIKNYSNINMKKIDVKDLLQKSFNEVVNNYKESHDDISTVFLN